jgi:hypothetical protein
MRLHLWDRRVEPLEGPAGEPLSVRSLEHFRELNTAAAAAIRRGLDLSNELPEVLEMVDGGTGPPSAVIPTPYVEHDVAKMDRQARDSTGKYVRTRRKHHIV